MVLRALGLFQEFVTAESDTKIRLGCIAHNFMHYFGLSLLPNCNRFSVRVFITPEFEIMWRKRLTRYLTTIMQFHECLAKAIGMPFPMIVRKIKLNIKAHISSAHLRKYDATHPTFGAPIDCKLCKGYFLINYMLSPTPEYVVTIRRLSDLYLSHRFDLLGSGWVRVIHGMKCAGLEGYCYNTASHGIRADRQGNWLTGRVNKANLRDAQAIWTLIDLEYMPIDWHLDFKSGYRWSEYTSSRDICFGHLPGVDVKVPWELARMQHLPMLAWAYALANQNIDGFNHADVYVREFRNQVLDFIATNPPRYGVNWYCTMDVGIRVANWLVTYDLFRSFGAVFDSDFEMIIARSVHEHANHCATNLEYYPEFRGNHHLSGIAGLLFAAAYLPETLETAGWLAFAVEELVNEMEFQFNPDGSNFESSTSYHRLATEIMLYSSVLCLLLPDERLQVIKSYDTRSLRSSHSLPISHKQESHSSSQAFFPRWFLERLERSIEFTRDILKPSGEIPQFGDNDSGRFLKIWPEYRTMRLEDATSLYKNLEAYEEIGPATIYLDEDVLDHRHLLGIGGVIFDRKDFLSAAKTTPEVLMVKAAIAGRRMPSYRNNPRDIRQVSAANYDSNKKPLESWFADLRTEFGNAILTEFTAQSEVVPLSKDLRIHIYPDFGLYLYRSPRLYLAVRCGSVQKGNSGHAHNDQLGIELNLNGKDLVKDPGTYVYTPFPNSRNQFRSTRAHYVPQYRGHEQNAFSHGKEALFCLKNREPAECLYFAEDGFVGRHSGFGHPVYRVIGVGDFKVSIWDFGSDKPLGKFRYYSNGYGKLIVWTSSS